MIIVSTSPWRDEDKIFFSLSNFTSPCPYTPEEMLKVINMASNPCHDVKTPYLPNSSVDINLVNTGVVRTEILFWRNEQIKYQIAARIAIGIKSYFFRSLLIISSITLVSIYFGMMSAYSLSLGRNNHIIYVVFFRKIIAIIENDEQLIFKQPRFSSSSHIIGHIYLIREVAQS